MKIEKLAEDVHRNHLQIREQLTATHKLKQDIQDVRLETLQELWIAINRRYLAEKLNHNTTTQYLELIDNINEIERYNFVKANSRFGSAETSLTELFQYLRTNPKLISYLLFFTEDKKSTFLDLLSKIAVSSVYSHCVLEQDRNAVVQILNELVEVYINFYNVDFRNRIYQKNSAFIVMFQSFCNVLPEVKTFFNLTLRQPVMQVLTEDTYYLDTNINNLTNRYSSDELLKHFGPESSDSYRENLEIYRKWAVERLKSFVQMFIDHLKCNIFAFPKSLASIFVRLFSKMIVAMDYAEVRTIFIDLLFSFLICPVIQNPAQFGVVDLHIDAVGQYNLQQCALIMRHLALSSGDNYREVCDLFEKDSFSFVIDHILGIFNTNEEAQASPKLNPRTGHGHDSIPAFLISEFELKVLLEFLRYFIERNQDCSAELKQIYFRIPQQCFQYEFKQEVKLPSKQDSGLLAGNSLKLPSSLRRMKSQETIVETTYEFNFEPVFVDGKSENFLQNYKPLMGCRKVFQFPLYDNQEFALLTRKQFANEFNIEKHDFQLESLLEFVKQKFNLNVSEKTALSLASSTTQSTLFESPQKLLLLDLDTHLNVDLNGPFGSGDVVTPPPPLSPANVQQQQSLVSEKLIDFSPEDELTPREQPLLVDIGGGDSLFQAQSQVLSPHQQQSSTSNPSSRPSSGGGGRSNPARFFNLNLKTIKDKVRNISIKDSGATFATSSRNSSTASISAPKSGDLLLSSLDNIAFNANTETLVNPHDAHTKFNPDDVKDKTDEILSKYRTRTTKIEDSKTAEILVDFDELIVTPNGGDPDDDDDAVDGASHIVASDNEIKNKLYKLFCSVNFSPVLGNFQFLNLEVKNHLIMFLKVLLSDAQNSDMLPETVLITDIINTLKGLSGDDLKRSVGLISQDLRLRHYYLVYLLKTNEYLLDNQARLLKLRDRCQLIQQETDFKLVTFLSTKVISDWDRAIQLALNRIIDGAVPLDEKIELFRNLAKKMCESGELGILSQTQALLVKRHIERNLSSKFYLHLFFANGDIDRMRDQIMHQQISRLSQSITPSSKLLKIPTQFQSSSPWPSAQRELLLMSVYKTAQEKVECIERCCKHIITLLNAADSAVPAADDLLPVLIFVVIKANPMSLLSTIQYVNAFLMDDLFGESAYYWTQFCSVVEFIKTVIHQQ